MSFLNQLRSQAKALQTQQGQQQLELEANTAQTEAVCKTVHSYLNDLARHLNVIAPRGPAFSLDGKTPWPAMQLKDFRVDARRKKLRDREVFDYIAMGWLVAPVAGPVAGGKVRVNFPPDLERVENRLAMGRVQHERKEVRHPQKNTLQAIEFEYVAQTRANVVVTPDHDQAALAFRLLNSSGFGIVKTTYPASQVKHELLDELAKLIVCERQRFA